jgi:hypothetical protein
MDSNPSSSNGNRQYRVTVQLARVDPLVNLVADEVSKTLAATSTLEAAQMVCHAAEADGYRVTSINVWER